MATDVVGIYNRALGAIGNRAAPVASPSEVSLEAETCSRWYTEVRDQILASAFWPSTHKAARLSQLAARDTALPWVETDPLPDWAFAYGLPADLLQPRYLSTFGNFMVGVMRQGEDEYKALMCNESAPILHYTCRQEQPATWDSGLLMAITYGLAAHICMPLTGKRKHAMELLGTANQLVMSARDSTDNVDTIHYESLPEWLAARGSVYSGVDTQRYIHPYGPLLQLSYTE